MTSKKKESASARAVDPVAELMMMRHSIKAIRDRVDEDLDALAEQIERLLPPPDNARAQRFKNFTKKDWNKYLAF